MRFVSLPQQGTGAIQYVPSGDLQGNVMYVNWDFGEVRVLRIDQETGLPIDQDSGEPTLGTENPVDERFAYDLGVGPWGLEFDGQSRDFFISTWNGNPANSILQITGVGFTGDPDAGVFPDAGAPDFGPVLADGGGIAMDQGTGVTTSSCDCRVGAAGRLPRVGLLLFLVALAVRLGRRVRTRA